MATVWTLNGRELESCDVDLFRYKDFHLVLVTGMSVNKCGHVLLNLGGKGGHYLHIADWQRRPFYLDESHYQTYLAVNHKTEIKRYRMSVPFPHHALTKMEQLISREWQHLIAWHNCATFVEMILKAGGVPFSIVANCPTLLGVNLFEGINIEGFD